MRPEGAAIKGANMILCTFKDLRRYQLILNHLPEALEKIEALKKSGLGAGHYEYEGFFINVQRGTTQPLDEGRFEAHSKYIDLHYEIEGHELMAYAPREAMDIEKPYDADDDYALFRARTEDIALIAVNAGMCCIMFPEDGHLPCRHTDKADTYVKMVVKIPVDR